MVLGGRVRAADTILWRPLELSLTGRSTLLRPVRAPSSGSLPLTTHHWQGWQGGGVAGRGRVAGWGGGVLGCWVLGSGGVACSRAAHDALGEAARDNDLLALLVHFGAARGQFRGLTFERRHPGSVRLAEGRSFASVHTHSAARERRRHGRRPGRAPPGRAKDYRPSKSSRQRAQILKLQLGWLRLQLRFHRFSVICKKCINNKSRGPWLAAPRRR